MKQVWSITCRSLIGLAAIVQLLFFPVITFAETPSPSSQPPENKNTASAKEDSPPETTAPTGAEASTYTYNEQSGLWENDHYTWNPVTKQTVPKDKPIYTYNPVTKTWDTTQWHYDAPSGKYVAQEVSVAQKPTGAAEATTPASTSAEMANGTGALTHTADTTVINGLYSGATSGDVTVAGNTLGGNAQSGNALAIANMLTMLQSSWGMDPQEIATFTANVNGDITGDLLLDPAAFADSTLSVSIARTTDFDVKVASSGRIANDITVNAQSGNAIITENTSAGNAVTGDATAIANIINLINSSISSGQSFVGNININGSLDGDILLPSSIKQQLLAQNTPTTNLTEQLADSSKVLAEFTETTGITNAAALDATSGSATVAGNTVAGDAQSGTAATDLTVFNLTGREVIGSNALLVFVNVLGEWVGMIVDAPAGTTAAMLGGDIQGNITRNAVGNTTINETSSSTITNNIIATANAGNASVTSNSNAGNAQSGDAKASANILNIATSQFSLADWFGVLFINVLGSWHGSFGVNTANGTPPSSPTVSDVRVFELASNQPGSPKAQVIPASINTQFKALLASSQSTGKEVRESPQVLASSSEPSGGSPTSPEASPARQINPLPAVAALLGALLLLGIERLLRKRAARQQAPSNSPSHQAYINSN